MALLALDVAFVRAFGGDLDLMADVRDLPASDLPLAFGFETECFLATLSFEEGRFFIKRSLASNFGPLRSSQNRMAPRSASALVAAATRALSDVRLSVGFALNHASPHPNQSAGQRKHRQAAFPCKVHIPISRRHYHIDHHRRNHNQRHEVSN